MVTIELQHEKHIMELMFTDCHDGAFLKTVHSNLDFNENNLFKQIIIMIDVMMMFSKNLDFMNIIRSSIHIDFIFNSTYQKCKLLNIIDDTTTIENFISTNNFGKMLHDVLYVKKIYNAVIFVKESTIIINYDLDKILDNLTFLLDNGAVPVWYINIDKHNQLNELLFMYAPDNIKQYFHENIRNHKFFSEIKT